MLSAGSTHQDVGYMWNAIEDASADIGIDPRVILGIMYATLFLGFFALGLCRIY